MSDGEDDKKPDAPFLVRIFQNGDDNTNGTKVLLHKRALKDWTAVLDLVTAKLGTLKPVYKLYTADGKKLKEFDDFEPNEDYVAVCKGKFIKVDYGGEKAKMVGVDWSTRHVGMKPLEENDNKSDEEKEGKKGKKKSK